MRDLLIVEMFGGYLVWLFPCHTSNVIEHEPGISMVLDLYTYAHIENHHFVRMLYETYGTPREDARFRAVFPSFRESRHALRDESFLENLLTTPAHLLFLDLEACLDLISLMIVSSRNASNNWSIKVCHHFFHHGANGWKCLSRTQTASRASHSV